MVYTTNKFIFFPIRILNKCYPCVPSLQTFTHYVLERCEGDSSKYDILVKFLHRYNRLKAAGTLLPQLIKFYLWLHTYLSHLITQAESTEMSVYRAIEVINENYSLQIVDTELFDTVASKLQYFSGSIIQNVL